MCSNMLGTILWQRKHGRPHKFLQVGTRLNNFKHERKKRPTSHEENGSQKEKQGLPHERKGPSKGKKARTLHTFFGDFQWGRSSAPRLMHLPPSPWSPMSENDKKTNNIFRNYSSHNDIKDTL